MHLGVQVFFLWFLCVFNLNLGQEFTPSSETNIVKVPREFRIDYEGDQFLLDGQPFRYISGSLHYFRVVRADWRDRLQKMRAAGLNAVSTYVEWSLHEPSPGIFDFNGDLDLVNFISVAQEEGLLVILRPGPYICAERDFGGLPPWLLTVNASMNLRSNDAEFLFYVSKWLQVLMPKVNHLLYENGGPIIMVQVENEYGSFDACDGIYQKWLRDLFVTYVGDSALLFTTDGGSASYLKCGKIPGVYATVDFGPGSNLTATFGSMRQYEPRGPLVNSEYYPGWLTHWEEGWSHTATAPILKTLEEMLLLNASVNFYVFFGGTNYAFTNGANYDNNDGRYQPTITSYDYDAPLTEAGDPTDKYLAIRNVIGQFVPLPDVPIPQKSPKGAYDAVEVQYVANVFDPNVREALGRPTVSSTNPLTFEALGQSYGFILYEATVPSSVSDPTLLQVPGIRDRASISVDGVLVGLLSRMHKIYEIPLMAQEGQVVQIFVENQGRINYGREELLKDFKGILGNVKLSGVGGDIPLEGWNMTGFPLSNITWIETQPTFPNVKSPLPAFFRGEFVLPTGPPLDTYLDMTDFGKGVVFVNGYNLGRYWIAAGPIRSLYVPKSWLNASPAKNNLVVLELEKVLNSSVHHVKFVTEHLITSTELYTFKG